MKKKLLLSILSLITVISLSTYTVYAWFLLSTTEFRNVIFTSGNIQLASYFWMIQDNNRDGYYDRDNNGQLILIDTNNLLTQENNVAEPKLALEGDIFSYRFLVQSTGDVPVALSIRLDNLLSPIHDIITWNFQGYNRYRSLPSGSGNSAIDFSVLDDSSQFEKIEVARPISKIYRQLQIIENSDGYIMYPNDIFVFDIQIHFERLEYLQTTNPDVFFPGANLNPYRNATFTKTTLYIDFNSL